MIRWTMEQTLEISIHTPLAGSDYALVESDSVPIISIHTPLAGSDFISSAIWYRYGSFQSTLPSRGVTAISA